MSENEKMVIQVTRLITQMEFMGKEISEIKNDVKSLNTFKWKAVGLGSAFGVIIGLLIEVFKKG
jgi:hypothetical protein